MAQRRSIGEILVENGRITRKDVERALEHQRTNGGYFGQALLELGLVSREELDWSLASQFDLPYVFPDADSVDDDAAGLVTPEWALAHMALPIMKTGDTLTVVVDFPMRSDAIDELEARTDLQVELALASPSTIRNLIREVYARPVSATEEEARAPITLGELLSRARESASSRFGISTRGEKAWAWYEDQDQVRRRPLEGLWDSELNAIVSPSPGERTNEGTETATWSASLVHEGIATDVEVKVLVGAGGTEYLFRPQRGRRGAEAGFEGMSHGIVSEIRLLARSGAAQFVVVSASEELGHRVLPHLPAMTLDPSWRAVYVTDGDWEAPANILALRLGDDERDEALRELRAFHFDVAAADLGGPPSGWIEDVLEVAQVAFILGVGEEAVREIEAAGVTWELGVEEGAGSRLRWSLQPIRP